MRRASLIAPPIIPAISPPITPDYSQSSGIGTVLPAPAATQVLASPPQADPMAKEIRRINSAHQPEVREVASDEVMGREIVDADARQLAAQKKSVRRQQRRRKEDDAG